MEVLCLARGIKEEGVACELCLGTSVCDALLVTGRIYDDKLGILSSPLINLAEVSALLGCFLFPILPPAAGQTACCL